MGITSAGVTIFPAAEDGGNSAELRISGASGVRTAFFLTAGGGATWSYSITAEPGFRILKVREGSETIFRYRDDFRGPVEGGASAVGIGPRIGVDLSTTLDIRHRFLGRFEPTGKGAHPTFAPKGAYSMSWESPLGVRECSCDALDLRGPTSDPGRHTFRVTTAHVQELNAGPPRVYGADVDVTGFVPDP